MKPAPAASLAAALIAASACAAATHDVIIENFLFIPETITVAVGDTVRWINRDFIIHTATSQTGAGTLVPNGLFDSGDMEYDQVFSFTFTAPGQVSYYCLPHGSSMQALVNVVAPPTCSADLTGDGRVNTADLSAFLGQFGRTGPGLPADFNADSAVNTADLTVLLGQFGCGT